MQGSASIPDKAVFPTRGVSCVPLERADVLIDGQEAGLRILILPGACDVQRQVAGQWVAMHTFYRSGILLTVSTGALRADESAAAGAMTLLISPALAERHFDSLLTRLRNVSYVRLDADPVVDSLMKVLSTATQATAPCVEEHVVTAVMQRAAVLAMRGSAEPSIAGGLPSWRLRRVVQFVNERLDSDVSLADMADAAGLSPMHFAALFKAATGLRPHHYLLAQRIEKAKQLLGGTGDTVLQIAMAVGFRSQAHFATVFKQHEDFTPTQWRQVNRRHSETMPRASHRARGPFGAVVRSKAVEVG
jgi:AraC-like DNA-binding protein